MSTITYADVEQLLIGWIPTILTPSRALTETPADMAGVLATEPVIRVTRIGGPVTEPGIDVATVTFDVFGLTRAAAKATALTLYTAVDRNLAGYGNTHGSVLDTDSLSGPSWLPWDDTNVRRFGFTSRIAVHAR